ncbi:MAG: hypothetical protein RR050_00495 [Bacilli bacterium]
MIKLNVYETGKKILATATGLAIMFGSIGAVKAATDITITNKDGSVTKFTALDNTTIEVDSDGSYEILLGETINNTHEKKNSLSTDLNQEQSWTVEEFLAICASFKKELKSKFGNLYKGIEQDICCLVYLANSESINLAGFDQELINENIIKPVDLTLIDTGAELLTQKNEEGWFNVNRSRVLINEINDYNDQRVDGNIGGPLKNDGIDTIIDLSIIFRNEHDKTESSTILQNLKDYGNALTVYSHTDDEVLDKFNRDAEITETLNINHMAITSLNADNENNNLSNLSAGARWVISKTYGKNQLRYIAFYLDENASRKELGEWFDIKLLNHGTFKIRTDITVDPSKIKDPMLSDAVDKYSQMELLVLDTSTKDFYKSLELNIIKQENIDSKKR